MRVDIGGPTDGRVCIVVDVLRASSSIVTLLERGCERVVIAEDVRHARKLHERLPDHLLCGEVGGLPPEGFDYGNSPVEFSRLDLAGKSVILATTNGTRAIADVAGEASAVLVGCLLNRRAVAQAAVDLAQRKRVDITVICAGEPLRLAGEDMAGAYAIVEMLRHSLHFSEVVDAERLLRLAGMNPEARVRESHHAQELRAIGLGEDVDYCAQLDVSEVVPAMQVDEDGLLRIVCHPGV